jgi:hypothetical protein
MTEFILRYPFAVVVIAFFMLWTIASVADSITKIWRKDKDEEV